MIKGDRETLGSFNRDMYKRQWTLRT